MYGDAQLRCPACRETLYVTQIPVFPHDPYRRCLACAGRWLQRESLRQIIEGEIEGEPVASQGARACPDCEQPLRALKLLGVEVDACDRHGVWLDAQELAALHLAVEIRRQQQAPGPLARAIEALAAVLRG